MSWRVSCALPNDGVQSLVEVCAIRGHTQLLAVWHASKVLATLLLAIELVVHSIHLVCRAVRRGKANARRDVLWRAVPRPACAAAVQWRAHVR